MPCGFRPKASSVNKNSLGPFLWLQRGDWFLNMAEVCCRLTGERFCVWTVGLEERLYMTNVVVTCSMLWYCCVRV